MEGDRLAPVRIDQALPAQPRKTIDQAAEGGIGMRLEGRKHRAELIGQLAHPQPNPGHHAEGAATALQRPEQVRIAVCVDPADAPVRRDDFRLQEPRGARAEVLGETAEPSASHPSRNADGGAAAALHIAARDGGDRVIGIHPHGSRPDVDRRLGALAGAPHGHEGFLDRDAVHVARPDARRVGGVRCALRAVAGALDDRQPPVMAGEADRCRHIGGASCAHCRGARPRDPGVGVAGQLSESGLIAQVIRIVQGLDRVRAGAVRRTAAAAGKRRTYPDQPAADAPVERRTFSGGGPLWILRPDTGSDAHPGAGRRSRQHAREWQCRKTAEDGSSLHAPISPRRERRHFSRLGLAHGGTPECASSRFRIPVIALPRGR